MANANPICSVPDCGKPMHAGGACTTHYRSPNICSQPGCNGSVFGRGLCASHYRNLTKRGHVDAGPSRARDGAKMAWLLANAAYEGDECIRWPFGYDHTGYGKLGIDGESVGAHRVMCATAHGEPNDPGLWALHSCGNGQVGCLNQKHLRWGTPADNADDRIKHNNSLRGELHPNARLNAEQVREILALKGLATASDVADRFDVVRGTVQAIWNGETWGWLV